MSSRPALGRVVGRGALTNFAFGVVMEGLVAAQAVLVPRLLGPEAVGLFALATAGVAIGSSVKSIDVPSKVVQERDVDLHTSYRVAFTLEMVLATVTVALVAGVAPLVAHLYHRPGLWPLMAVLSLTIYETALLDLPASLPYRQMRFVRRNMLMSVGPVVGASVTLAMAYLGSGVWSLAGGTVAGTASSAVVLGWGAPIRPRLVWDRSVVRRFLSFAWPLWGQGMLVLVAGWGAVVAISGVVGVAGLGYFELAQGWASKALQMDGFLSDALFPALCSLQSAQGRLRRAFVVTNRLSMLWAAPVGLGMVVLAHPATALLVGHRWIPAVTLVRAEGISIVLNAIGMNWRLFYVARGDTRPLFVTGVATAGWLVTCVIPLLLVWKLAGAAVSIILLGLFSLALRQFYVRRMLGGLVLPAMVWREVACGAVAAGAVELARLVGWRTASIWSLAAQATVILSGTAVLALLVDRQLVVQAVRAVIGRGELEETSSGSRGLAHVVSAEPVGRPGSFPMLVAPDGNALWVATRDWPALGRLDLASSQWTWTALDPYPHAPSPDGRGGCWSALTRSRSLVHVDASGQVTTVPLPSGPELLVSCVARGHVWAVDSRLRRLWKVPVDGAPSSWVALPEDMARPDFCVPTPWGAVWVADTAAPVIAAVGPPSRETPTRLEAPHPTRCVVADEVRGGCWLGASDRAAATLLGPAGDVLSSVELPGVPFGMTLTADGRLVAAVKDHDAVAVADPETGRTTVLTLEGGDLPFDVAMVGPRCFVTLAGSSRLAELRLPEREELPVPGGPAAEEAVLDADEGVVVAGQHPLGQPGLLGHPAGGAGPHPLVPAAVRVHGK